MAFFIGAVIVASVAVSYVMTTQAMKKAMKAANDMAGVLFNKESNIEPIPVIYGQRRVGGVRVFVSTKDVSGGDKNEFLYIALVLSEGEVNAITDIHLDDVPITDSKYTGLYTVNVHTGADDQAYDDLLTEANSDWDSTHTLSGVAYLAIKLKWNRDIFQGIPEITALVSGRKVYDPREDSTSDGYVSGGVSTQRFANPSTWTFSNNPSLCLRDYLTNERFGKGIPAIAIDDAAFGSAATDCDESVVFYVGAPSGKIFETNAVLQTDETLFSNIEKLLMGCRGFLPYTQGKYGLLIDKSKSSSFAFDTNTIVGGISIEGESKENKFNRVIAKFANPAVDYQPDQVVWPESGSSEETAFLSEDNGTLLVSNLELETITNYYAARDLARVILKRSRSSLRCNFKATSEALQLSVGDVVTVTHPTPSWVAQPFQVEDITLNYDGTCSVSLLQYDSTIYTYDLAAQEITYPQSALPDPFEVGAPRSLQSASGTYIDDDGTTFPIIQLTWLAALDSFVDSYIVEWKKSSEAASLYQSVSVSGLKFDIGNVESGVTYNINVYSVNSLGVKSSSLSVNAASAGDTTAPALPSSVTATGGQGSITLAWVNPSDKDFSNVEIYRSATSGGTFAAIASVSGGFGIAGSFVNGSLVNNEDYFYKLRSVDYSGNKSVDSNGNPEYTAEVSATTNAATLTPRENHGYVYLILPQDAEPSAPTATDYDYDNNTFSNLTSTWQVNPLPVTSSDGKYWASSFKVIESTYDQSQPAITFSSAFVAHNFDGLVTFTNFNTGLAASTTTIDGDKIKTGIIEADRVRIDGVGLSVATSGTEKSLIIGDGGVTNAKISGAIQSTAYNAGLAGWKIDKGGDAEFNDAVFRGTLTAASGTIGDIQLATGGDIRSGQTAFNTGTGFFLGDVAGTPKFSIGNPNGANLRWTGTQLIIEGQTRIVEAGNEVLAVTTKGGQTNFSSFVKVAEITVGVEGSVNAKFTIAGGNSSTTAYGKIYVNGSGYSSTSSKSGTGYSEFTKLVSNLDAGDTVELWIRSNSSSYTAFWGSYGLYVTEGAVAAVTFEQ